MEYKIELTVEAVSNIRDIHSYIGNSQAATAWYLGLKETVASLHQLPQRGRVTPEDSDLRQLLYGRKPHIYRIVYRVDQDLDRVLVLHIRHGARSEFQHSEVSG